MGKKGYVFREEQLICGLCSKQYNQPRSLPCLHSFCEKCIADHINKIGIQGTTEKVVSKAGTQGAAVKGTNKVGTQRGAEKDKPGVKGFPCPCCKKFVTTPNLSKVPSSQWPQQFPINSMLTDLVGLQSLKAGTRTCDPCSKNQMNSSVHSYCKNCRAALCEPCMKTHRGLRMSNNHKVIAASEFASAINSLKVEEEFCFKHPGKSVDQYCNVHAVPCCSSCISESHRRCDRVVPVSEEAKNCREKQKVAKLEDAIAKYKGHLDIVLKNRSTQIKQLESKKSKLLSEFASVKSHIISQLEKLERDLKKALEQIHKRETKKVHDEVEKCQEIQSAVVNTGEVLEMADNHGADSHLLDTTEKVRGECELYEEHIAILCSQIRKVDYDITLDRSLEQGMQKLNQFGRVDVNTSASGLPPSPKVASSLRTQTYAMKNKASKPQLTLSGKQATEIGDFNGRTEDDSMDCWFTSAKFLSDGRVLLTDRTNLKLKLFSSNFRLLTDLVLSSKPWDVAVISDKQVAVTLPAEHRIQFVEVDKDMLGTTRAISLDEACFGLHYVNEKLLTVTYSGDPPNLKVLNLEGQELTYICVDEDGFPLFSKPIYVTSNKEGSQLYVSDERLGCLVNLTENGDLNFNYSAMDLGHAAGLALDAEGNIYVCGNTSNSVHVVSPSGERVKVLVTGDSISYPRAIAYDPQNKKLLVTQGDQDVVKVFSLS